MLELTVSRTVTQPAYQVFEQYVQIRGEKLTPTTARRAIAVAFGSGTGTVTCSDGYGYRVYPNSIRKFYFHNY